MVFGWRIERQQHDAEHAMEERVRNVAAFPLAIPLLAGPGAITAVVLLAGQAGGRIVPLAWLIGVIAAVAVASLLTFLVAERIGKLLGITGNVVLSRLLGVILAALAVQYVIDGIRTVFGLGGA
jgi:multiple antibiotic resistance protein